jgi:hypothetical protein
MATRLNNRDKSTKINELGVFTIGIGVLIAALAIWFWFMLDPPRGKVRDFKTVAIPVAFGAVYILLGLLTLKLRSRMIIQITSGLVTVGLLLELINSFHIGKLILSGIAIWLINTTAKGAVADVQESSGGVQGDDGSSLPESEIELFTLSIDGVPRWSTPAGWSDPGVEALCRLEQSRRLRYQPSNVFCWCMG